MDVRWLALAAICIPLCASAQGLGERPSLHLQAERYVWTTAVDGDTRQYRNSLSSPTRPGPVYLWLMVRGDDAALDYLRHDAKGTIPVFMFWMRRSQDGFFSDRADVIEVSVAAKDSLPLLSAQLAQEGAFSWRIWTGKKAAAAGAWRVRVVDRWGSFLTCPTDADANAPCDLEIEIAQ